MYVYLPTVPKHIKMKVKSAKDRNTPTHDVTHVIRVTSTVSTEYSRTLYET